MAAVPITFQGMMYPRDKSVKPYPFTALGTASITGLEIGGGPIIEEPPDIKPQPPLVIWGGPFDPPHPAHPIVLPDPPIEGPPDQPPTTPEKPHPGWNWSALKSQWYFLYVPGSGQAQPKK